MIISKQETFISNLKSLVRFEHALSSLHLELMCLEKDPESYQIDHSVVTKFLVIAQKIKSEIKDELGERSEIAPYFENNELLQYVDELQFDESKFISNINEVTKQQWFKPSLLQLENDLQKFSGSIEDQESNEYLGIG